jgi:hypothetical protein
MATLMQSESADRLLYHSGLNGDGHGKPLNTVPNCVDLECKELVIGEWGHISVIAKWYLLPN